MRFPKMGFRFFASFACRVLGIQSLVRGAQDALQRPKSISLITYPQNSPVSGGVAGKGRAGPLLSRYLSLLLPFPLPNPNAIDAFSEDGLPILRLLRLQSAWGLRFEVEGLEFWVEEVGSGIEGSRFRIECALFSGPGR